MTYATSSSELLHFDLGRALCPLNMDIISIYRSMTMRPGLIMANLQDIRVKFLTSSQHLLYGLRSHLVTN